MLGRFIRTVRHLRPVQVYGRILFRCMRPRARLSPPPPPRTMTGVWTAPARRAASLSGPRQFWFLNAGGDLDELGWNSPATDKLWLYNQHYFDDLNARNAADRVAWHRDLIDDWLAGNPPGAGNGWEPYPTSLRIVNWLKWAMAGNELTADALASLAVQTRWLMQRLEWHLLGNHLFVNAKALVFAGLFFEGDEAQGWLDKGLSILRREIPEQILPDGGQFELSPMYHALALEDLLDLINLTRRFPGAAPDEATAAWVARIGPMRAWLTAMRHPDGEISFFNDAAMGVAPTPAELEAYATRLGFPALPDPGPLTELASSGYVRARQGRADLIVDMAPVGPDYLPGHAHADTLSFELSLDGRRLIVNSGASLYGADAERLRQRGTAAHSALVLDGQDSSEVWSGFRVGRRARIVHREVRSGPSTLELEAAHDGYRHLTGRPIHQRRWSISDAGLVVSDAIIGEGRHEATIHFHLGRGLLAAESPGEGWRIVDATSGRELATVVTEDDAQTDVVPTTWHPEFGRSEPAASLRVRRSGQAPFRHVTEFRWSAV